MHVSDAEIRGIFASDAALAFFTPQQRERALGALDRHAAQEAEDERCYEEEQGPFLERILPQMIAEFSTELQQLKDQQWEKASFERAVKVLTKVEQKWDELNGKGLKALFRTNFFYKFNASFFEPLLNKLMTQHEAFQMMMSNSRAQQEKQTLTALFDKYQSEDGQKDGINTEEKTKALAFLIFVREEYMNH